MTSMYQDWVIQVDRDLRGYSRGEEQEDATPDIFKIPSHLREASVESFDAKFFSFGLYDLETRKDFLQDTYRKEFARIFMEITGKTWNQISSEVVEGSDSSVEDWVRLYDGLKLESILKGQSNIQEVDEVIDIEEEAGDGESAAAQGGSINEILRLNIHGTPLNGALHPELSKLDYVKIWLTLDAVFIVCFIQGFHQRVCHRCKNRFPILNEAFSKAAFKPLLFEIRLDIFKYVNQIPLGLIKRVVNMMPDWNWPSFRVSDPFNTFVQDAVDATNCLPGGSRMSRSALYAMKFDDCKHLLECLYVAVCYRPPGSIEENPHGADATDPEQEIIGENPRRADATDPQQEIIRENPRGADAADLEREIIEGAPVAVAPALAPNPRGRNRDGAENADHEHQHTHRPDLVHGYGIRLPSISQLKTAGIEVAVAKGNTIYDVSFKSSIFSPFRISKLYLPIFDVYDETDVLLRNLFVYESVVKKKAILGSFIYLMENLIITENDVELLLKKRVLRIHAVGRNRAMAEMWSTMTKGMMLLTLTKRYSKMYSDVSYHYTRTRNRQVAEFKELYCSRVWLTFGLVVVVASLTIGIVGVVYTLLTYYQT